MNVRALAAVAVAALLTGACERRPASFTLSVVGTNDLHGGILGAEGGGGLAWLGGYLSNLRAARQKDGGAVLLLDAGDLFKGTLESDLNEGAVVVEAYNALGYQAATIGNHEFDYGPAGPASIPHASSDDPLGALKARLTQARFPWVAANLVETASGRLVPLPNVTPSTILTIAGVRVGIVGLLTEPAMTYTVAANVSGLAVAPITQALIDEARRLREQGVPIVIGLAHAGGKCVSTDRPDDLSTCEANAEIFELARRLPRGLVDAIVAGHRHDPVAQVVNGVPIIQSWWRGRAFGRVDLTVDRDTARVLAHRLFQPQDLCGWRAAGRTGCAPASAADAVPVEYEGLPVHQSEQVAAILKPAADAAAALKARPLNATLTATLLKSDFAQSPVGDLEMDWMRAVVPGADAALANSAGLRSDLAEGPLTYGKLYELLPFDNLRLVITLTGKQLRTVIADNVTRSGSMVMLAGVRAEARCDRGFVSVSLRRESGRPIEDDERLRVVTTDFLATGGDSFFTSVMPLHLESTGEVLRDEIAAYLSRTGGSWGRERLALPNRLTVAGTRPLPCAAR
ncbi:MAG TPA: bifunctional UDP-sugar hydrolase/5'-nucleotidase [Vicinamibacterales bacterium]|nr:bifunctional UDP-sugar hydrolase/5'-nucleotidase [Vicinamibacterales bacterium]